MNSNFYAYIDSIRKGEAEAVPAKETYPTINNLQKTKVYLKSNKSVL
jgi:hypothetical protein